MSMVYLLRHAQSTYNATHGKVNEVDADLSRAGEAQATTITGQFDLVLCSPMRRARRTLELSKIKYTEMQILTEARELRSIKSDFLEGECIFQESHEQMRERIKCIKDKLKKEVEKDKTVLLVTHSAIIRTLTSPNMHSSMGTRVRNGQIIQYYMQI